MIGRGDQYGVDVVAVEQLAVVEISFGAADALGASEAPLIYVAHGSDLQVIIPSTLDEFVQMTRSHATAANHAKANAIVGAQHRSLRQPTEGECAASRHSGGFKKVAARDGVLCHRVGSCGGGCTVGAIPRLARERILTCPQTPL